MTQCGEGACRMGRAGRAGATLAPTRLGGVGNFSVLSCVETLSNKQDEQLAIPPTAAERPDKAARWHQAERITGLPHARGCPGRAQALQHTHDAVRTARKNRHGCLLT